MINFKEETIKAIRGREIEEYRLRAISFNNEFDNDIIFEGTGDTIPWDLMDQKTHGLVSEYDDSYGSDCWGGWITFRDGTWVERKTYDGSEWWDQKVKPSLTTGILNSIGEFGGMEDVEIIRNDH